jgi:hypothetical protein
MRGLNGLIVRMKTSVEPWRHGHEPGLAVEQLKRGLSDLLPPLGTKAAITSSPTSLSTRPLSLDDDVVVGDVIETVEHGGEAGRSARPAWWSRERSAKSTLRLVGQWMLIYLRDWTTRWTKS